MNHPFRLFFIDHFAKRSVWPNPCTGILVMLCAPVVFASADMKTTILIPLDEEASWRDMAYLAAVPASEKANSSGGSLIALEKNAIVYPELQDYLRRYQPDVMYLIGGTQQADAFVAHPGTSGAQIKPLPSSSAEDAALHLSRAFWKKSSTAVICRDTDYESALMAAPLAALLNAPLLYAGSSGISPATQAELTRLGATRVVSMGEGISAQNSVALAGPEEVMKWTKDQGVDASYVAAVNPLDRTRSKVRKLSLLGAQLAAGRGGLVAPLANQVEWKKPFKSVLSDQALPAEFKDQTPPARVGTLQSGSKKIPFILSGKPSDTKQGLFIDRELSGDFFGPIHSGDIIDLDGRQWVVSLGIGSSYHDADVHITWPTVDMLTSQLGDYYKVLGQPPAYLCLVGLPDVIPQGLVRGRLLSPDIATDLPFALYGDRTSARIAVGRVVAEHISYGSLYAARVLTYSDLLDPTWSNRACQAEWENTLGPLFANAGFNASYRLTQEDIPWVEKPTKESKGKRATSFTQDSPLTRTKLLAHMNHSWNFELGSMLKWDANILMAPSLVESGGCGTTSLDRSAPGQAIVEGASGAQSPELAVKHRSVVSRLFRLGAISFSGGSREMMAENLPIRQEYWNGILAGNSAGESHRQAQNIGFLILKERGKEMDSYAYWHTLHANTLLGDPAVRIQLPGKAITAPARTDLLSDRLTVYAPEKWTCVKMFVPPDWKKWANRDIFVARAPGAYSLSTWGPEERDVEIAMVKAQFHTDKNIKTLTLLDHNESPPRWSGVWHTDRNRDGTYTHRLGLRMLDFDQEKGLILKSVKQLDFAVTFE